MKIVRKIIESITMGMCMAKKNRVIKIAIKPGEKAKVNLGCGLSVTKGWINIDGSLAAFVSSWPECLLKLAYRFAGSNRYYSCEQFCSILKENVFIHHDLSYGIPLPDNSADYIYSSHFLEHLFRSEAEGLIKDSYRVLKKGGTIRICVPDLNYAIGLYGSGSKHFMLEQYFFVEDQDSFFARHKYMYDCELLSAILQQAGFGNISQCCYQQGTTPDVKELDNRPEGTIFLEAKKI